MRTLRNAAVVVLLITATGAVMQAPASQSRARRALPGDLTKPIGQYTGDEFATLVGTLTFTGGQQRARRCSGNPGCGNTMRTNVRVDAVTGEDSLAATNLPQFGVVAMRAIVRGNQTEAMYGMQPTGANGRFTYYLIVSAGAPGTASWSLEELSVQGNSRAHRTVRTGRFTSCAHPYVPGARADFKTCAAASAAANGPLRFLNASFGSTLQPGDPPMWVSCAGGCCIVDGGSGV